MTLTLVRSERRQPAEHRPLDDLRNEASAAHQTVQQSSDAALDHAKKAGDALREAHDQLDRGGWPIGSLDWGWDRLNKAGTIFDKSQVAPRTVVAVAAARAATRIVGFVSGTVVTLGE